MTLTKNTEILRAEVAAHIRAEALVRGSYWKPSKNAVGGQGWTSYRYAGRYGHIMIGATSTQDALNKADRSLTQGAATVDRLEIWNALTGLYEKVKE